MQDEQKPEAAYRNSSKKYYRKYYVSIHSLNKIVPQARQSPSLQIWRIQQ
jgi:hypothetical protein